MGTGRTGAPAHDGMSSGIELQGVIWRMRADLERLVAEAGPARMELPNLVGHWTLKSIIAHLTAWRCRAIARRGEEERAVAASAILSPVAAG